LEYTGLSLEGNPAFGWQSTVHPDDLDAHTKKWLKSLATGEIFEDEARFRRAADGEYRWFLVRAVPLRDEYRNILKWYGVLTDITERKLAEEEREKLRKLEADLAHINRVTMMGELAASLGHEIKQPITAATTNARTSLRWLDRQPPEVEEARQAISRIVHDVTRAAEIMERNRSLYEQGASQRESIDLNEIIRLMVGMLREAANRYAITIRTELDDSLPLTMADRLQLQQVLMNLMLNGIEAMKDTSGELAVTSKRNDDGQILVSVSDLGVGLPVEKTERIFEAFFTTKPHGTGMGLSISRRIVESHGGRLWARANSGRGSCFQFTIPIAQQGRLRMQQAP